MQQIHPVSRREVVEIRDAVTLMLLNTLESSGGPKILRFSPDSRLLTNATDLMGTLVTWDLQTGGSVDTTFPEDMYKLISSTYSIDGKMLAAVYPDPWPEITIATHDLSTAYTHLYQIPEGHVIAPPIWNHGKFLRFTTVKPGSIAI